MPLKSHQNDLFMDVKKDYDPQCDSVLNFQEIHPKRNKNMQLSTVTSGDTTGEDHSPVLIDCSSENLTDAEAIASFKVWVAENRQRSKNRARRKFAAALTAESHKGESNEDVDTSSLSCSSLNVSRLSMSGRGSGDNKLCTGDAKRVVSMQVLGKQSLFFKRSKGNIQDITKSALRCRRLARRGGVKYISGLSHYYEEESTEEESYQEESYKEENYGKTYKEAPRRLIIAKPDPIQFPLDGLKSCHKGGYFRVVNVFTEFLEEVLHGESKTWITNEDDILSFRCAALRQGTIHYSLACVCVYYIYTLNMHVCCLCSCVYTCVCTFVRVCFPCRG